MIFKIYLVYTDVCQGKKRKGAIPKVIWLSPKAVLNTYLFSVTSAFQQNLSIQTFKFVFVKTSIPTHLYSLLRLSFEMSNRSIFNIVRTTAYFCFCPLCSPSLFCFFSVKFNGLARLILSFDDDRSRSSTLSFRRFEFLTFKLRRRSSVWLPSSFDTNVSPFK